MRQRDMMKGQSYFKRDFRQIRHRNGVVWFKPMVTRTDPKMARDRLTVFQNLIFNHVFVRYIMFRCLAEIPQTDQVRIRNNFTTETNYKPNFENRQCFRG